MMLKYQVAKAFSMYVLHLNLKMLILIAFTRLFALRHGPKEGGGALHNAPLSTLLVVHN